MKTIARHDLSAILLLGVLLAACPLASALSPGPILIQACPGCSQAFRQFTIGSGNSFGAESWTDGFVRAPMLPEMPALVRCAHCRKLFWLADAKELDRIELGSRGDKWNNAKELLRVDENDFLAAAAAPKLARDREIYARQHAWWRANDPVRDDPKKSAQWTETRKRNLERLSTLFDESKVCELVGKAEIARELRQFDRCLTLLRRPIVGDCREVAEMLARLAREKSDRVEKVLYPKAKGSKN